MIDLLCAVLPSWLHIAVRRWRGQTIDRSARLKFGTVLRAESVDIRANAVLGPFCLVDADAVEIGERSSIKPLAIVRAKRIAVGNDSQISSLAIVFEMGAHSQVFPFCWLEPGDAIRLGSQVGIGGHGLIFTHGSWANYFKGGPMSTGPVIIEDGVWLPWRVFVMPGVRIGAEAIVLSGSVVTADVPSRAMAAGSPAKVIRAESYQVLSAIDVQGRIDEALRTFSSEYPEFAELVSDHDNLSSASRLVVMNVADPTVARTLSDRGLLVIDPVRAVFWGSPDDPLGQTMLRHLRTLGVRAGRAT
jgi:acetyltransferase-like isoleucine patch superfamily enzyme